MAKSDYNHWWRNYLKGLVIGYARLAKWKLLKPFGITRFRYRIYPYFNDKKEYWASGNGLYEANYYLENVRKKFAGRRLDAPLPQKELSMEEWMAIPTTGPLTRPGPVYSGEQPFLTPNGKPTVLTSTKL